MPFLMVHFSWGERVQCPQSQNLGVIETSEPFKPNFLKLSAKQPRLSSKPFSRLPHPALCSSQQLLRQKTFRGGQQV